MRSCWRTTQARANGDRTVVVVVVVTVEDVVVEEVVVDDVVGVVALVP